MGTNANNMTYNPQTVSVSTFWPFGNLSAHRRMLSKSYESGYRYGFNGKENDNEVLGLGRWQDYGERQYRPDLGRFFSPDPLIVYQKKYPELSIYQFASNTSVQAIDLDGLEGVIVIDIKNEPKGFNKVLFAVQLKTKLIENGAHPETKVVYLEDYGIIKQLSDWWSGKYKENQSGRLIIKDFVLSSKDRFGVGGYSELNSGKAIIYTGLNPYGENKDSKAKPLYKYVNAALHELGHSIYGFEHDEKGNTSTGEGLMDYDHVYEEGATFDEYQQYEIYIRAYGVDAISSSSKSVIPNKDKESKNIRSQKLKSSSGSSPESGNKMQKSSTRPKFE